MSGTPEWLDDKGKIIEHKYCQCFLAKHPMLSKGKDFFTTEGVVTDKDRLLRDVFDDIKEHAKRNANNLVEFLQSEGYIQLKADSTITSRELYAIYQMWCEDNGCRPIAQRSVCSYLKSHLEDYNLEASNKITNKSGN